MKTSKSKLIKGLFKFITINKKSIYSCFIPSNEFEKYICEGNFNAIRDRKIKSQDISFDGECLQICIDEGFIKEYRGLLSLSLKGYEFAKTNKFLFYTKQFVKSQTFWNFIFNLIILIIGFILGKYL